MKLWKPARGVDKILEWSTSGCADMERLAGQGKRSQDDRHVFLHFLAELFTQSFAQPPAATEGGPWEVFLREVLHRCTGKKRLSRAHVHRLWMSVRPRLERPTRARAARRRKKIGPDNLAKLKRTSLDKPAELDA